MAADGAADLQDSSQLSKPGLELFDKAFRDDDLALTHTNSDDDLLGRQNNSSNAKRMLESVYGVETRAEQPQPRKRVKAEDEVKESSSKKQEFRSSGTGIVGDYMNPAKDPDAANKPTLYPASVVDLTNDDDDDDDIQVTGSTSLAEKEVCYGAIYESVDAFYTPKLKNRPLLDSVQWPPIAVTLERKPESTRNTLIQVIDPHGLVFANCSAKLAKVLAPVMDGFPRLRLQARLMNRQKQANEWPHQPCSQTMKISICIYGRRCDAEKIGRLFGQENIWFIDTTLRDQGVELFNPQRQKPSKKPQQRAVARNVVYDNVSGRYDAVSEEEAAQTVAKIFEHFASEKLAETEAPPTVLTPLLSHQKQALTFMLRHESRRSFGEDASGNSVLWQKKHHKNGQVYYEEAVCSMTTTAEPPQVLGGLLADVMGLGKTLESLALMASTLGDALQYTKETPIKTPDDKIDFSAVTKATLVVCPMSTVANWESQIREHLDESMTWYTHHGTNRHRNPFMLCKYDIVITTYGTLQSEARRGGDDAVLRKLKWFRIILDEAHTIREPSAQQSQACYELEAPRRWALTGTPIQNKLGDLGSLCQFLQLFPYHTAANFQYYIGKRAMDGDPEFLLKLRIFIDSFTLRRLRDKIDLPPKEDLVEEIEFSPAEFKLHDFFRKRAALQVDSMLKDEGKKKQKLQVSVLQGITTLRLISAHGREMLRAVDLDEYKGANVDEPIDLDDDTGPRSITQLEAYEIFKMMSDADFDVCQICDKQITPDSPSTDPEEGKARAYVLPCRDLLCPGCFARYKAMYDVQDDAVQCPFCSSITASQYVPITGLVDETIERLQQSRESTPAGEKSTYGGPHSKTRALLEDLESMTTASKEVEARGEPPLKCVVFSEFTSHLKLIARALKEKGYRTEQIDGTMSLAKRKKVLELLENDDSVTILLASIKAAGQGLNLTAASRVFIMEPLWNPAAEAQAVDRIYRIGQKRPVVVKRYRMKSSIEEVITGLAKSKQQLADLSLERNHKMLSKKEHREARYNEIKALFAKKR